MYLHKGPTISLPAHFEPAQLASVHVSLSQQCEAVVGQAAAVGHRPALGGRHSQVATLWQKPHATHCPALQHCFHPWRSLRLRINQSNFMSEITPSERQNVSVARPYQLLVLYPKVLSGE